MQEFAGALLRILNILHAKLTLNMYIFTGIDENFYLTVTGLKVDHSYKTTHLTTF